MTNFEKIKSMTISELVDWLNKYSMFDGAPWMAWFNYTYCNECEPIECTINKKATIFPSRTINCAYCELEHKCKYFPALEDTPDYKAIIRMWLEEEAKND